MNLVSSQAVLFQMISGYWISGAISVVAKLGIADLLKDNPKTCESLAESTGADAVALYRVMRALASVDVFAELKDGYFALTPKSEYLLSDVPGSLRAWAILQTEDWRWRTWGQMFHNVKTGETAFEHVHGMRFFEYLDQHADAAKVYNQAISALNPLSTSDITATYDFSQFVTIVDVGGGHGAFLINLLKTYPEMSGILFDQHAVVEGAKERVKKEGLAERCQLIGGDFFSTVPGGGNAYLLKQVIHVLGDDELAIKLLKNCRQAMGYRGKLLIIEQVIPPNDEVFFGRLLDLDMMAVLGGRVRTEAEFTELLETAGFTLQRIIPMPKGSPFSIVEAHPDVPQERRLPVKDWAPLIERAFSFIPSEQSYTVEEIDGTVPDFVRGTYYMNGPSRFSRGPINYRHWLDGDGMVCALRFESGCVQFTNRFVKTEKFVAEEAAGRPIFRTFGTAFESDQLKRGIATVSPANVSVYPYNGTLLAFGEQNLPWELHPVTLETQGEYDFGGHLNDVSPFAAHPKFDSVTGDMFNFGVSFSATRPRLNLYRFDKHANLIYRKRHPLDYPRMVHDFSLSASYAIFYLSPHILNMEMLMRRGKTIMDSLSWEPTLGSRLLIIARETGEEVASIPLGRCYCLHLINSFEEEESLMVDVVEFERPLYDQYQEVPSLYTNVSTGQPVRFIVDVANQEITNKQTIDYQLAPDFASVNPRQATQPYSDFWMLGISTTGQPGRKFFDQLVHASWTDVKVDDIYQAPAKHYLGAEPVFIGAPGRKHTGAVICQIFDAENVRSAFVIFDAFDIARGPMATLHLKAPIHFGLHTTFTPEN